MPFGKFSAPDSDSLIEVELSVSSKYVLDIKPDTNVESRTAPRIPEPRVALD